MTKRNIAKHIADQIVVAACTAGSMKVITALAPNLTADHTTSTKIVAGTSGILLQDKLQARTHATVDFVADKIAAHKAKKTN